MNHRCALIALCLFVAGCGDSQGPGSLTGPTNINGVSPPPGAYTITGTIRDVDGVPVAGVTLASTSSSEGRTVVSDAAGAYSLRNIAGLVTLRVSKDGYFESSITAFIASDQVLDIKMSPLVQLIPGTTLRGTVRGAPCDPIGWDATALCQRIHYTPSMSGTLDLALAWSGPSMLDILVNEHYFDLSQPPGEIHARLQVVAGRRYEIRIHAYYSPQDFELRAEFQPTP